MENNELKQALEAMEARIMKRFQETDEQIHALETSLLREIYRVLFKAEK